MVERSLSMREAPGSIPGLSTSFLVSLFTFTSWLVSLNISSGSGRGMLTRKPTVGGEAGFSGVCGPPSA